MGSRRGGPDGLGSLRAGWEKGACGVLGGCNAAQGCSRAFMSATGWLGSEAGKWWLVMLGEVWVFLEVGVWRCLGVHLVAWALGGAVFCVFVGVEKG